MIDLIHVGDYKTGTTWLQNCAFQQHPELIYVDNPAVYPEIVALFYELVDARDLDFDADGLRERFRVEIGKIDRLGKKLVVSREALSGNFLSGEHLRRNAERLKAVFGPVKVLVVIREQFAMLASTYSQYVKMGGTLSLRDFIYDPFVSRSLLMRLQYQRQLQSYCEIFGAENVMIRLYEELRRDNAVFLSDVFTFVGCKDISFQPVVQGTINPSLTSIGMLLQRGLNRFTRTQFSPGENLIPLDRLIVKLLPANLKQRLLRNAQIQLPGVSVQENMEICLRYSVNIALNYRFSQWCEKIRVGRKVELPADMKPHLHAVFAPGNHILADKYGLAVQKHDWAL